MITITDVEALYRIPDNELNKLTAKDRLIIFSRAGSQMPMSKFQALAAIKAKMEIVEYPAEIESMEMSDQAAYAGYLHGMYAATAKQQEPVRIYSSLFDRIAKSSAKNPAILKNLGKVQFGMDDRKPVRKTTAKQQEKSANPVQTETAKKSAAADKKTETKPEASDQPRPTEKKTGRKKPAPLVDKMCSMGLEDMRAKLSRNEEQLIKALNQATDDDLGYRFLLKMTFGEEDSTKIWEKTRKAFATLKEMAANANI